MTDHAYSKISPISSMLYHAFAALRRAGASVISFIDLIYTAGPRSAELRRLVQSSDDDLRARGVTREAEINRIFAMR